MASSDSLTSLRRVGSNEYSAMLVASGKPANWSNETLLLRFVEKNGASTPFFLTGEALQQFKKCEQWCIYDITVPGKCVKTSSGVSKYGVNSAYEVVLKLACSKLEKSQKAWTFRFPYTFVEWSNLQQSTDNTYVDIIGQVLEKPVLDANSVLPKKIVLLGNQNLTQEVHFLGDHSHLRLKARDNVSLAGVKIHKWQDQRTIQTTYLSVIEINPTPTENLILPEICDDDAPKRKAMRFTPSAMVSIEDVKKMQEQAVNDFQQSSSKDNTNFSMVCKIAAFDTSFFTKDLPVVDVKEKEVMCISTSVQDQTGTLTVKLWDRACYELFKVTASELRELWEQGINDLSSQNDILQTLNQNLDSECECACSLSTWQRGFKDVKVEVNINVNAVEIKEE